MTTVFVFGSNLAGRHGKGAALEARMKWGAEYGVGRGRTGNAYAIPTKGYRLEVLPLSEIRSHVRGFVEYAMASPDLEFHVTAIGCGLAGYKHHQIAPMFMGCPSNVRLPAEWSEFVTSGTRSG
ncbi:MAG: hypothetical protein ABL912_01760 [Novosphingobium sp.]